MKIADVIARTSVKTRGEPKPFDLLRTAVANSGDGDTVSLTVDEIAILYRHFMPKTAKAKKGLFDFAWVALAAAVQDLRAQIRFVYSTGSQIAATDGHRLHVLSGQTMPAGYYTINGDPIERPEKFPDFARVIPDSDGATSWTLSAEELAARIVDIGSKSKGSKFVYKLPSGHKVAKKYLDGAVNGAPTLEYYSHGRSRAICIREGDHTAVIMPIE